MLYRYRLRIIVALAIVFSVGIAALVVSYSEVGVTSEVGVGGFPRSVHDLSAIPQSVVDDATELARELFGDGQEGSDEFVNQLLAAYLEAKDKDFVVFFNPGGWGWGLLEASAQWQSIFTGVESELNKIGYTSLWLNYQRTTDSLLSRLKEVVELVTSQSSRADDLGHRVEFLTRHVPDLKVIIAGESTGTVISDRTMSILVDNPQVYSIQTGPPFWRKNENMMLDRTLVLTDNGVIPDSFSQGDFFTIIRGNLAALFGLSQPEACSGDILYYVKAPGHDYRWDYPGVCSEITGFLERNFAIEW